MTDRKLTEAEMISYLELSVAIGGTASLAPEEAKTLLDLVNRQKAKIKALQMDNAQLQSDIVNANMNADHALAEIERLKNPIPVLCVDELTDELIEVLKKQPFLVSPASNEDVVFLDESKIKSEAVKEMDDKIKELAEKNATCEANELNYIRQISRLRAKVESVKVETANEIFERTQKYAHAFSDGTNIEKYVHEDDIKRVVKEMLEEIE